MEIINNIGLIMFSAILIGYSVGFIFTKNEDFDIKIPVILVSTMMTCLFALVFIGLYSLFSPKIIYKNYVDIASVYNDNTKHGSFFLGSGTIHETEYYFYFKKLGNNSYIKEKVKSFDVIIVEDNNQTPKYSYDLKCIKDNIFIGKIFTDSCDVFNKKLIVPEGTIIKEYNLK